MKKIIILLLLFLKISIVFAKIEEKITLNINKLQEFSDYESVIKIFPELQNNETILFFKEAKDTNLSENDTIIIEKVNFKNNSFYLIYPQSSTMCGKSCSIIFVKDNVNIVEFYPHLEEILDIYKHKVYLQKRKKTFYFKNTSK